MAKDTEEYVDSEIALPPAMPDQSGLSFAALLREDEMLARATPELDPVDVVEMRRTLQLPERQVDAKDLVGVELVIYAAKPFLSAFEGQKHAFFCHVKVGDSDEMLGVVLGGVAVLDYLNAWYLQEPRAPMRFRLGWVSGGRYSGYYTIE